MDNYSLVTPKHTKLPHTHKPNSPQFSTGVLSFHDREVSFDHAFSTGKHQTHMLPPNLYSSRNHENLQSLSNSLSQSSSNHEYPDSLNPQSSSFHSSVSNSMMILQLSSLHTIFQELKHLKYDRRFSGEVSQVEDLLLVIENSLMASHGR